MIRSPTALLLGVVTLGLGFCLGCGKGAGTGDEPRLVLLYMNCTLNRSYLQPYDAEVTFTPNIARFASEGVVFENHHSETGVSGPCFASTISGTQAQKHKVYYHPRRLPEELPLLAESYRRAGYDTHFWSGHPMAAARLGYGMIAYPHPRLLLWLC